MSTLRDEIRAILRQELAALQNEMSAPVVEQVTITSTAELDRFARALVDRAADPDFAQRVRTGQHRFEFTGRATTPPRPIVTGPAPVRTPERLDKALVTERDIAELPSGSRCLRVEKKTRLTPLAQDEAKRRGIRIERCET